MPRDNLPTIVDGAGLPDIPTRESPVFGTLPAGPPAVGSFPLAVDIELFLRRYLTRASKSTVRTYGGALRAFERTLSERLGRPSPSHAVTAETVDGYIVMRRRQGVASGTIEILFQALQRFFEDRALFRELPNPIANEDAPQHQESPLPDVPSVDEMKRLCEPIGTSSELRNDALLSVLYGSGLRISEAQGLRWSDLIRAGEFNRVHVRAGKGSKDRIVPMTNASMSVLTI
jgi:integrase/recombinase XerC